METRSLLTAAVGLLLRCCVALWPHSGQSQPPMYGDYEAQRHWMEVTHSLPLSDWYRDTADNNLQYWGLDYPPLTAYHSRAFAAVAASVNQSYVKLHESRGLETPAHRRFMRCTVLLSDILVLFPAAIWLASVLFSNRQRNAAMSCVSALLLCPALVLIDHGHFQYNGVSLGLTLGAVAAFVTRLDVFGAALFALALNFKQMELYHALPIFSFLLCRCWRQRSWLSSAAKLVRLGLTVIVVFVLLWLPFIVEPGGVWHVLTRLFPFGRGVFEDKVANLWCSVSLVFKLQHVLSVATLVKMCACCTLLAVLPSCLCLLSDASSLNLRLSLVNSALAFFLFSFQVHEKSILLAAVPACTLFPDFPLPTLWFIVASTLSMLPLLIRDGLLIPTVASTVFYCFFLNMSTSVLSSGSAYRTAKRRSLLTSAQTSAMVLDRHVYDRQLAFAVSMFGFLALTLGSVMLAPPLKYPDLWPVLLSAYSFCHFAGFFVYFHLLQFGWCDEKLKVL